MPYEYELLKNKTFKSESIFRLKHYHGISPENNHPDVIFVSCLGKFGGFVQNEIHEWVKATQNAFYRPASIDLQLDLKYEKISCKNIKKCYIVSDFLPFCPYISSALGDVLYSWCVNKIICR